MSTNNPAPQTSQPVAPKVPAPKPVMQQRPPAKPAPAQPGQASKPGEHIKK